VRTEEGHMVLHEAKKLQAENALHSAHVEAIARDIAMAEKQGVPVLAARTEEGAKHMREIAKAENSGLVTESEAKKMVAKVVVHEIVSGSAGGVNQEQSDMLAHSDLQTDIHASLDQEHNMINPDIVRAEARMIRPHEEHELVHAESRMARGESRMIPHLYEEDNKSSKTTSMAELAHEVLKRKQEETARRGGVEPSSEELRRICAGVLNDYRGSSSCGADCARKGSSGVSGNDELASSYASADHR
jgi:dihydroorotase-like cyclic amidohydrolase